MDCAEIRPYLEPYADGELGVDAVVAMDSHLAECAGCREQVARQRRFRELLRRQPQETAAPELRARVAGAVRREARRRVTPWMAGAAAAAALLALVVGLRALAPSSPPAAVAELVAKHVAFSRIDSPVEFAATDGAVVRDWFRERLRVGVTVPDYTPAGIRLLGGRIADTDGRPAAYLLYEKGRTLMSVFMVPGEVFAPGRARTLSYHGATYYEVELAGQRAVFWSDRDASFGLISALDEAALLECAARLRALRAEEPRA